jgi:hypothetical protein
MLQSDKVTLPPAKPVAPDAKVEAPLDKLPAEYQKLQLWAESLPSLEDAEDSQKLWSSESMAKWHETSQVGSLGAIPLIVLTRSNGGYGNDLDAPAAELESERKRLQSGLTTLSSNGKQILVDSGHNMHLEAPQVVADTIQSVIEAAKKK